MAEPRHTSRARRAACLVGGALAVGGFVAEARAAETAKPAAAAPVRPPAAATPAPNASTTVADVELLEFLGSDDVDPDLQQYLANRATARDRSEKK